MTPASRPGCACNEYWPGEGDHPECPHVAAPASRPPGCPQSLIDDVLRKRAVKANHRGHWDGGDVAYAVVSGYEAGFAAARLPAPQAEGARELRPSLLRFALHMEAQLRANDHKRGWQEDDFADLFARLEEESEELGDIVLKEAGLWQSGDPRVLKEAADVANFAMMIADNCEIEPAVNARLPERGETKLTLPCDVSHASEAAESVKLSSPAFPAGADGQDATLSDLVPSNWCDPLLIGDDGIGAGPYGAPDIERLLLRIKERIRAAEIARVNTPAPGDGSEG